MTATPGTVYKKGVRYHLDGAFAFRYCGIGGGYTCPCYPEDQTERECHVLMFENCSGEKIHVLNHGVTTDRYRDERWRGEPGQKLDHPYLLEFEGLNGVRCGISVYAYNDKQLQADLHKIDQ